LARTAVINQIRGFLGARHCGYVRASHTANSFRTFTSHDQDMGRPAAAIGGVLVTYEHVTEESGFWRMAAGIAAN
jgi:hypothetical protein